MIDRGADAKINRSKRAINIKVEFRGMGVHVYRIEVHIKYLHPLPKYNHFT